MFDYVLYNGSFYKSGSTLVGANNRGLRYGDGLFETLRVEAGRILFNDWHFERLFQGMQLLGFELPGNFTAGHLQEQVRDLCKKNSHSSARVRINVIRGDGGLYDPENHFPNYIIQSWKLEPNGYQLNENGLVTGIYTAARKSIDSFANIKSNNFLPYSMAALYTKQLKWNDAFLLNSKGTICDATIANVFMIKNGRVLTPALSEGCIAGVMRRFLIEQLPALGFDLRETSISPEEIMGADEVFLTNTIRGIRWVQRCESAIYANKAIAHIYSNLLKNMA